MKNGPFLKTKNTTEKIMRNIVIALFPIIIFSFYKNGIVPYIKGYANFYELLRPLVFIITGSISSIITECIYYKIKEKDTWKDKIRKSYPIFPGLLLSLILPTNTPIQTLMIGSIIASLIGKLLTGGFGKNKFNSPLIGYLFVLLIFGGFISNFGGNLNPYETKIIEEPIINFKNLDNLGSYESLIKPFGTLLEFFIGLVPNTLGGVSPLLCVIAFIFLIIKKSIKWKIPLIFIITIFILTWIIGKNANLGIWYPFYQICSGGLLFWAIFIISDSATSPVTTIGQIIYAIVLAILTVSFNYLSFTNYGILLSTLVINMFVPLFDKIGSYGSIAIKKVIIPLIFSVIISILLINYINDNYSGKNNSKVDIEVIL